MKNNSPLLSVVATSRNDDHGGDALWRTQHFVDGLVSQAEKHKINLELILVDWNPVPNRDGLHKALKWPKKSSYFKKRVITVPKSYHDQFKSSQHLPLFQYLAKNVGIRRAHGEFILSTNIDILFSDGMFQSLKSLKSGVSYRALRYDILPKHMQGENFRDILKSITRKGIRAHGQFQTTESKFVVSFLQLGPSWVVNLYNNSAFLMLLIYITLRHVFLTFSLPKLDLLSQVIINYKLHTSAPGDFALMSKRDWFRLRGHPEFEMYSWHIDSLFLYQAYFQNIKTKIFPHKNCIYHIEHGKGSGWTPGGESLLFDRLRKKSIDFLTKKDLRKFFKHQKKNPTHQFNDDDWGGASETFQENS